MARRKHGLSRHRLYSTWRGMMYRCYNSNTRSFIYYGGRGISVCERWHDVANFVADMAASHRDGRTLDRINNDGNYEPGNCRWATARQQATNTRPAPRKANMDAQASQTVHMSGKSMRVDEWADDKGIQLGIVLKRMGRGRTPQKALVGSKALAFQAYRREEARKIELRNAFNLRMKQRGHYT